MPDVRRTKRRGVFTNGFAFYINRRVNGRWRWRRFDTFEEASAYQDEREQKRQPRHTDAICDDDVGLGWVYFVAPIGGGPVKIGWTASEPGIDRLRALQCGSPVRLELVGAWPAFREDELTLHEQFAEQRLHGEWFTATDELLAVATYRPTVAEVERRGALWLHEYRLRLPAVWSLLADLDDEAAA